MNPSNIFAAALLLIAGANAASSDNGFYFTCTVETSDGSDAGREVSEHRLDVPVSMDDFTYVNRKPEPLVYFRVRRASQLRHSPSHPDPPTVEGLIENCRAKAQASFPDSEFMITGLFVKDNDEPSKRYHVETIFAWNDKSRVVMNKPQAIKHVSDQMEHSARIKAESQATANF